LGVVRFGVLPDPASLRIPEMIQPRAVG